MNLTQINPFKYFSRQLMWHLRLSRTKTTKYFKVQQ